MDQHSENNPSQPQITNPSSSINDPSLPQGAGKPATILQVGGQSFLLLNSGQQASSLQGMGINLVPVGESNTSLIQPGGPQAQLLQVGGIQQAISKVGGKKTLQSQSGSVLPGAVKISGLQPSALQFGPSMLPKKVQASELKLKPSQIINPAATIFQVGGLQSSTIQCKDKVPAHSTTFNAPKRQRKSGVLNSVQSVITQTGGIVVPTQIELTPAYPKIKTEPGLEEAEINPLTIQASGHYAETSRLIGFPTPTVHSGLVQPYLEKIGGIESWAPKENVTVTKEGSKCQQAMPKYVDAGCSVYNVIKMKHASTNTSKRNKSVATQVKISLNNKSQAIQFPGINYEVSEEQTQECSTQSEDFFRPGQLGLWESRESDPCKVLIFRDPEPEKDSIFVSETRRHQLWNMEEVEKWIHGSYEEHPHFDDVAVYFTEEEWECLNKKEKKLYKKVMMDNFWNLTAVGGIRVTPPVISKIERGEDPCLETKHLTDYEQFPDSYIDDQLREDTFGEWYNIQRFYERLKIITSPIRLAMAGLTVTKIVSGLSSYEPTQDEDRIKDPGDQCPFKSSLKQKPVIEEKPFCCFKCKQSYKRFGGLVRHYSTHQSEKDLTCPDCGKNFKKNKDLLLHHLKHSGERPFVCSGCGAKYASPMCLSKHFGSRDQFECFECGKKFRAKQCFLKHQQLHQMGGKKVHARTHTCSHCGQSFKSKASYQKHMLVHKPTQLFDCPECGTAFIHESQLVEHQKLHQTKLTL